ncbi:TRAP transporter small permease [Pelagibius sp. Alg239-R121]|uniref:TRAP transporter small permease n=1 Tax=Pelagibius sp. Alg239-R121 TaxID=2993448 RepID=UPI0024A72811|nr:TRAP transporter small permease [Pelagibius sp. Alg239-R121]
MSWAQGTARWIDRINRVAALICHALLAIITAVTVLQVFLRFVLNRPTSWSEEIALLCLIWFGLLAVAVGIRRHEHVAITYFRDLLPGPAAASLDYLAQAAMAVFMFSVMFFADDLIALTGVQVLPASGFPKSLLYFPAILGGLLGTTNALANMILRDVHFVPRETLEFTDAD